MNITTSKNWSTFHFLFRFLFRSIGPNLLDQDGGSQHHCRDRSHDHRGNLRRLRNDPVLHYQGEIWPPKIDCWSRTFESPWQRCFHDWKAQPNDVEFEKNLEPILAFSGCSFERGDTSLTSRSFFPDLKMFPEKKTFVKAFSRWIQCSQRYFHSGFRTVYKSNLKYVRGRTRFRKSWTDLTSLFYNPNFLEIRLFLPCYALRWDWQELRLRLRGNVDIQLFSACKSFAFCAIGCNFQLQWRIKQLFPR